MIYTSYFSRMNAIKAAVSDAAFVSIAGKTPDGFTGEKYMPLMPKYTWWRQWHDLFAGRYESQESKDWYSKMYNATVLENLDPLQTARALKDLCGWHTTFILCYEPPEKFCHRHLVADWLNAARVYAEEWTPKA